MPVVCKCALAVLVLVSVALPSGGCGRDATSEKPGDTPGSPKVPPNIILYVVDTVRADSLACYGHPVVQTPSIDQLAEDGVLFENAYSQTSWTRPSFASMLTSLYPDAHGTQTREDRLDDVVLTLPEALKKHGYATAAIVTNPNIGSFFGFAQGFDQYMELYDRRQPGPVTALELTASSEQVTAVAKDWMASVEQPFFLMILTVDPHEPYVPAAQFDRYGGGYAGSVKSGTLQAINRRDLTHADQQRIRSLYLGEITHNDTSFGDLRRYLAERALDKQTIVVFTSDHGEELWEHGMRGHGYQLYVESLHVPLIIAYPGVVKAGERFRPTVESIDIFPTVFELANLPIPPGLQGRSLFGRDATDEVATFARLETPRASHASVRDYPWKLIRDLKSDARIVFNVEESPDETVHGAGRYREEAGLLMEQISNRMTQDAERFAALYGDAGPEKLAEEDWPEDVRRKLKALGYLGGEDGP